MRKILNNANQKSNGENGASLFGACCISAPSVLLEYDNFPVFSVLQKLLIVIGLFCLIVLLRSMFKGKNILQWLHIYEARERTPPTTE